MLRGFFSGADMKTEREQLRVFVVFLFIIVVMSLSTASFAALSLSPVVPGYSAASGGYRAAAGSFTMAAANSGFIQPAVATVAGKPITVSATLRMAANAGQFAKNAMRLNPWAIAGTLAAGYLADQLMQWDEPSQQWQKTSGWSLSYADPYGVYPISGATCVHAHSAATPNMASCYVITGSGYADSGVGGCPAVPCPDGSCNGAGSWETDYMTKWEPKSPFPAGCLSPAPGYAPATQSDWDALPDPLPVVAPELPYAPYMPDGVPVDAPNYDFVPFSAPLGQPYTKPDGSTVQPMAKVSPNGDSITVDTYDQPLTTPDGQPVTNPTPQDTPEPARDPCLDNPDRLGCMNAGSDNFTVPKNTINFSFVPESSVLPAGGCPAPISVLGQSISYQPACNAMSMIRPVVLGMASIMAAFILVGAFKGGD